MNQMWTVGAKTDTEMRWAKATDTLSKWFRCQTVGAKIDTRNEKSKSKIKKRKKRKTPTVGLEPTTTRLRALRSTDWARRACMTATSDTFSSQWSRASYKICLHWWAWMKSTRHLLNLLDSDLLKSMPYGSESSIRFVRPTTTLTSNTSDPARILHN